MEKMNDYPCCNECKKQHCLYEDNVERCPDFKQMMLIIDQKLEMWENIANDLHQLIKKVDEYVKIYGEDRNKELDVLQTMIEEQKEMV